MQHRLVTFGAVLIAALWVSSARAGDFSSQFGFGISVPDVWLVLSQNEVADNAELLSGERPNEAIAAVPASMREAVVDRIRAGELEIFYRQESVTDGFVDNVNVMTQATNLPASRPQVDQLCRLLPAEFSRVFGRPIGMDRCEVRERAARRALYLQFDGAIPGTTTLQYQLQRQRGETLVLTATATNANLPRMLGEFEQMVASIRLY
jgi:hypothetical protein